MPKYLVIVESPSKAKTINAWLGPDYIVQATHGHIKDLPEHELGIDVANGFAPHYVVLRHRRDTVALLRQLAARCQQVFIATDPDREGEAIAHDVAGEITPVNPNIARVLLRQITRDAVGDAFKNPTVINRDLVSAQQARRVADRLIGFNATSALRAVMPKSPVTVSAGRVQTVALMMLADREREIASFLPTAYFDLVARFRTASDESIQATLVRYNDIAIVPPIGSAEYPAESSTRFIRSMSQARTLSQEAMHGRYTITAMGRKTASMVPPPPYTTATLLHDASERTGSSVAETMRLLQSLYEGAHLGSRGRIGLITYPRTDSEQIDGEAMRQANEYIYEQFGAEYCVTATDDEKKSLVKKNRASAQDAHKAIRPADLRIAPRDARRHLEKREAELYELIFRRYLMSRMAPAVTAQRIIEIGDGTMSFRAVERRITSRGWMQAIGNEEAVEQKGRLPDGLRKHHSFTLESIAAEERATESRVRFSEGTLVLELERHGIGRPGTYAATVALLLERGHAKLQGREMVPTPFGASIAEALRQNFPEAFNLKFTARIELALDAIAAGTETYEGALRKFYRPIAGLIATSAARKHRALRISPREKRLMAPSPARLPGDRGAQAACPECGAPMVERRGAHGAFMGCSRFPKCRGTLEIQKAE